MNQLGQTYPFSVLPLPYSTDSLAPAISRETLLFHHGKHLNTYVSNLNRVLKENPEYQSWTLFELLYYNHLLPKRLMTLIRSNAGGVYNHELYFSCMKPQNECCGFKEKPACSDFYVRFNETFSTFAGFKTQIANAASRVFGSGYVYLVKNKNRQLSIVTSANQDIPFTRGYTPLLALDLWEHAYYLDYQNRRTDYINMWFNLINWGSVEEYYIM